MQLGTTVATVIGGEIWKFPLVVGSQGKAQISVNGYTNGWIEWSVKPSQDVAQTTLKTTYQYQVGINMQGPTKAYGSWSAEFVKTQIFPVNTSLTRTNLTSRDLLSSSLTVTVK